MDNYDKHLHGKHGKNTAKALKQMAATSKERRIFELKSFSTYHSRNS